MINMDTADKDFEKKVDQFDEEAKSFIKTNIVNAFVAFIISEIYQLDLLYNFEIENVFGEAIETLYQTKVEDCNIDKVNEILKTKYNLELKDYTVCKVQELES